MISREISCFDITALSCIKFMLPRSDYGCAWPPLTLMGGDVLDFKVTWFSYANFSSMFLHWKLPWQPMKFCPLDSLMSRDYFDTCYLHVYPSVTHKTINFFKLMRKIGRMFRKHVNISRTCAIGRYVITAPAHFHSCWITKKTLHSSKKEQKLCYLPSLFHQESVLFKEQHNSNLLVKFCLKWGPETPRKWQVKEFGFYPNTILSLTTKKKENRTIT